VTAVLLAASGLPLDPAALTPGEAAQYTALSGEGRRRSWLTARRALKRALAARGLPTDTSAYGLPSPAVSLSHSAELAIAAVAVGGPAGGNVRAPGLIRFTRVVGIGVDVELDRSSSDLRTAPFFLTADELAWLEGHPAPGRTPELLRLWTVKEALFKADPGNGRTVLRDYAVTTPGARGGPAARVGGGGPRFRYVSIALRRGALSVALALSPPERTVPMQTIEFEQVVQRIGELISVPVERLTPEARIAELLPDSFMFIEVAVDLQEEFDVVLAQRDLTDVHTLGDLAALLRDRRAETAGR
jgi:acyl carrier protein/4'-phosphopantetheinyl transferase EntD